jgi:septal ring factor EnvC (AmiA/AmiB activator)
MLELLFASWLAYAQETTPSSPEVSDKIEDTRAGISEDERRQREALSHLFLINKKIKSLANRQAQFNDQLLQQEAAVRAGAQDVARLEQRRDLQRSVLNKHLRRLYQERDPGGFHWLFSARSPLELERNHRYLRLMADEDHRQLQNYLRDLDEIQRQRRKLKDMVARLARMQKQAAEQESELNEQQRQKSRLVASLDRAKDAKLSRLRDLRRKHADVALPGYAFFERKGQLRPPVDDPLAREYGTYVDPQFRFRLAHKGLFYGGGNADVRAVFGGRVVFADALPGYGRAVILDHGDNYYSVYAFASKLKVREGLAVHEGEVVAVSGGESPLFGPGLYFEIRHFTDAVDPRPWFKESLIKTADIRDGENL